MISPDEKHQLMGEISKLLDGYMRVRCDLCLYFDNHTRQCDKFASAPPPEVMRTGCGQGEEDIPF